MEFERFIVDLENNHHYILVDTITGYQYYTPAQDDAVAICGMLNSQQSRLESQRKQIADLQNKLKSRGINVGVTQKNCSTCKHCDLVSIGNGSDVWCNSKDRSVYKYDYCKLWVQK